MYYLITILFIIIENWNDTSADKCFVPSDVLYQKALSRDLKDHQLVQYGLPIRRGFWDDNGSKKKSLTSTTNEKKGLFGLPFFAKKEDTLATTQISTSSSDELKAKLGLEQGIPTVMVVGGGDGMGGIIEQARSLGGALNESATKINKKYQMVVICGNNKQAQQTLTNENWGDGVTVQINGFVNNMDEYMRASDAIVTKAGPGTIAEASICGLPCMLSSYL